MDHTGLVPVAVLVRQARSLHPVEPGKWTAAMAVENPFAFIGKLSEDEVTREEFQDLLEERHRGLYCVYDVVLCMCNMHVMYIYDVLGWFCRCISVVYGDIGLRSTFYDEVLLLAGDSGSPQALKLCNNCRLKRSWPEVEGRQLRGETPAVHLLGHRSSPAFRHFEKPLLG